MSVTTLRCTCAGCGSVDVPLPAATLLVGGGEDGRTNQLEFACPGCSVTRVQDADERATRLLSAAGVLVAARCEQPVPHVASDGSGRNRPAT